MSQSEEEFENNHVIEWLKDRGWKVLDGEKEPFVGENSKYTRKLNEVIYEDVLRENLQSINNTTEEETDKILSEVTRSLKQTDNLLISNKKATSILRSGGSYETEDGKNDIYSVFDFKNPQNNELTAIQQFTYEDTDPYVNRRPDIVLFINGIPLVVIELKSVSSKNTTGEAIRQIRNTYEDELSKLFVPNLMNIVLNQNSLRYGSVGSSKEHYHYWKENDKDVIVSDVKNNFKDLIDADKILDILKNFVFFKEISEDNKYAKIIPRHQQYYSTKKIIDDIKESESKDEYSTNLIVHVQGSGKSYAMMYAANILSREYNYPSYIVVDSGEILEQFEDELGKISEINETVVNSDRTSKTGTEQLEEVVNQSSAGVKLTIIHLFEELDDNIKSDRPSVVFADEAHRFQDKILGSKMESTLDPFHYYGYTGTPIEDTYEQFSQEDQKYLDKYSMSDAINEGAILPVNMKSKRDMISWLVDDEKMDRMLDKNLPRDIKEDEKRRFITKNIGTQELAGLESRMDCIVDDVIDHFTSELRSGSVKYKGMLVTKGKENAAKYGKKLEEELGENIVDVIYSKQNTDSKLVQKYHKTKEEREQVIENFKEEGKNPQLIVVCDMLRTGFDAPILRTIYLDRRFNGGHTLLQTIARTNRTRSKDLNENEGLDLPDDESEKLYGEIIDYQGITEEFNELVDYDKKEIDKFTTEDKNQFKKEFKTQIENVSDYFDQSYHNDLEDEDLKNWANQLVNIKDQDQYIRDFQNLRTLYRNISPDKFLVEYESEYEWYSRIYDRIRTSNKSQEEEVKNSLVETVKNNVEVEKKENYNIDERTIDGAGVEPLEVTKKKATIEEILSKNRKIDYRYEKLSERVEDVISKWNQELKSPEEVLEELENIEEDADEIKEKIENSNLTDSERALKSVILEYDVDDETAEDIATSIIELYNKNPPKTEKWWRYKSKRDYVENIIMDELYPIHNIANNTNINTELLKKLIRIEQLE